MVLRGWDFGMETRKQRRRRLQRGNSQKISSSDNEMVDPTAKVFLNISCQLMLSWTHMLEKSLSCNATKPIVPR